jgi:hypothetical protein
MCKQVPVYVYACGCTIKRLPLEGKDDICVLKLEDPKNTSRRRNGDNEGKFCSEVGDVRLLSFFVTGEPGGDVCFTGDASGDCPSCREEMSIQSKSPDLSEKQVRHLARAVLAEEGWNIPQTEKELDHLINQSTASSKLRVHLKAREISANASRRLGKILVYRPAHVVLRQNPYVVLDTLSEIASLPNYVNRAHLMWKAGTYIAARYEGQKDIAQARAALLGYEASFADRLKNKWLTAKERKEAEERKYAEANLDGVQTCAIS